MLYSTFLMSVLTWEETAAVICRCCLGTHVVLGGAILLLPALRYNKSVFVSPRFYCIFFPQLIFLGF